MANAGNITSIFNIQGKIAPSFTTSITQANRQLIQLQRSALAVGTGFGGLGRSLLGIATTGLAAGGMVAMFQKSVQYAKQEQGYLLGISTLLKANRLVQSQGANAYRDQTEAIKEQAKMLQTATGISKLYFEQGANILATYHMTGTAVMDLQKSIAQVLVTQRNLGAEGKSYAEVYEAIGKAITTGQPRGLKAIHIEVDPNTQKLMEMFARHGNWGMVQNMHMLQRIISTTFGDAVGNLQRMEPLLFKFYSVQAQVSEAWTQIGQKAEPIQQKLVIIFGTLGQALLPYVNQGLEWFDKILTRVYKNLDKIQPKFQSRLHSGFEVWMQFFTWMQHNQSWLIPAIKRIVEFRLAMSALALALTPVIGLMNLLRGFLSLGLLGEGGFVGLLALGAGIVIGHWTKAQDFFKNWYDGLPSDTQKTVDSMTAVWGNLFTYLNKKFDQLPDFLKGRHSASDTRTSWDFSLDKDGNVVIQSIKRATPPFYSSKYGNTPGYGIADEHVFTRDRNGLNVNLDILGKRLGDLVKLPSWAITLKDTTGQLLNNTMTALNNTMQSALEISRTSPTVGTDYFKKPGVIYDPQKAYPQPKSHIPWAPGVYKGLSYGPIVKEYGYSQTYGALQVNGKDVKLGDNDFAVAPNLAKKYPLGSMWDYEMNGKVYRNQRAADWSYISPNNPNYNAIEQRHIANPGQIRIIGPSKTNTIDPGKSQDTLHGNTAIKFDNLYRDMMKAANTAAGITLQYHSEHHHYGKYDEKGVAETQRKHANDMVDNVEQAFIDRRRRSFTT